MSEEDKGKNVVPIETERKKRKVKGYFEPNILAAQFAAMSRQPFIEILSELIQAVPCAQKLQEFADDHPDKWASTIKTMSNLAGFNDKLQIEGNINIDIQMKGDAELLESLNALNIRLKTLGFDTGSDNKVTDADYEEIK